MCECEIWNSTHPSKFSSRSSLASFNHFVHSFFPIDSDSISVYKLFEQRASISTILIQLAGQGLSERDWRSRHPAATIGDQFPPVISLLLCISIVCNDLGPHCIIASPMASPRASNHLFRLD